MKTLVRMVLMLVTFDLASPLHAQWQTYPTLGGLRPATRTASTLITAYSGQDERPFRPL